MLIPEGYTEQQVLATIEVVVNRLASSFRFSYHEVEDLKQEGRVFAIKALNSGKYDPTRPLENFLQVHVRNRMINFKRDKYNRNPSPCIECPFFDPHRTKSTNQCTQFEDREECSKFKPWNDAHTNRLNILTPMEFSCVSHEEETNLSIADGMDEDIDTRDLLERIDEKLPVRLRKDYLKMRDNISVPQHRRNKVRQAIKRIIAGMNADA